MVLFFIYSYFLISSLVTVLIYFKKTKSKRDKIDSLVTLMIYVPFTFWINLFFDYYVFSIIICILVNYYYGRLLYLELYTTNK